MADGGSHFAAKEVQEYCEGANIKKITTAAYSPWVNGLVEGGNKILLGWLMRLCAPNLEESEYLDVDPQSIPESWPDHLGEAVWQMNNQVLPVIGYTPREILLGLPFELHQEGTEEGPI
ncbi:hypothetical protein BOTBODRAFT_47661 [Botryobasidium botryosum FD-172 SS1]|uniref:Integrase catalytic domain-containing protein n=1 Tax=Botryobasidium botryosum (strain FD-172 SS1) TaxID=930990 RepID=A0A067MCV3_BOTB1|nr:hypothetical protein BOTBODRAFT_47661 [Botryobasidium botryosum FD-172 SS1]